MAAPQVVPSKTEMREYLRRGLTQKQIAEIAGCSRSAISMAIERYELKSARPRARYMDLLPWKVSNEHRMRAQARLLRLESRRRQGKAIGERDRVWLNNWLTWLDDQNAVVMYDPDTKPGFFYVPREESDDDIVRRPPEE